MAGAKEINFAREGKVLRVLPSGRWVPRKLEFKEKRIKHLDERQVKGLISWKEVT